MLNRRASIYGVAVIVVLVAVGFFVWRSSPEFRVSIDQSDIQAHVSARLPLRHCALVVACLEVNSAQVLLAEGSDRIGIRSELLASLGNRRYPGVAAFSGKPRYVPGEGKVFVDDLRIDDLQLQGLSSEVAAMVKLRGPALLHGALQTTPIYTIRGKSIKADFVRFALHNVQVVNGKLLLTLRRPDANP
ncbi:MAG: DUF1439 domain-containing protein [Burkholderiales bacterium]|nr:DUF1439 domain-containing protein [Burkholderiales bacterium]